METVFIFLLKSGGLIGMFYLSYYILLRKETFFNSNRWFLLAGLISSVILPLVVFTKIIWVDPAPTTFNWSEIPITNTTTAVENDAFEINWYLVFTIVYSIGIVALLIKFAFDFYSLSKVIKGKTIQRQADLKFINVTENISPFSFFNYIVYNSSLYSDIELENILEHEKVHSTQNHTVDVLVSRLFCIVFWFNPFVWLYKKVIVQNLEFIADSEAAKSISDKKAYQLTLLKITTQEDCVAITNHFYQSLIKKRIFMLNKNQSKKWNSWKYAVVLPLLGAFLFLFQTEVVAKEKTTTKQKNELKLQSSDLDIVKVVIKSEAPPVKIKKDTLEFNAASFKVRPDANVVTLLKQMPGVEVDNDGKVTVNGKTFFNKDGAIILKNLPAGIISKAQVSDYKTKKEEKTIPNKINDIVFIDGKKISQSELENNFVFKNIKDVKIVKGKTNNTYYITTWKNSDQKNNEKSKEEEEAKNENKVAAIDKIDLIITKNTSDAEINEKCQQIKKTHNIDLSFFNIKRNINGEIMHIESKFEGDFGASRKDFTLSRNPIEPFKFFFEKKIKEEFTIGFASLSNMISRIIDDKSIDYKKAVILIDGKQVDYQDLEKVNPKEVKRVITSDIKSKAEENKKYVGLYGEKALYGILIHVQTNDYFNKNN